MTYVPYHTQSTGITVIQPVKVKHKSFILSQKRTGRKILEGGLPDTITIFTQLRTIFFPRGVDFQKFFQS